MTREPNTAIRIANKIVSRDAPALVVAEAACNHFCDLELAFRLIDEAAGAGADAIKFQTYKAERLTVRTADGYGNIGTKSQYDYYKQFDRFDREEYEALFDRAHGKDIIAFSTPFDPASAQMLMSVDAPAFKIASCDILYGDLLREVACFNRPIIVSTGAATPDEIETCLAILDKAGASDVILMACTMAYPTKPSDANYRRIVALQKLCPDYLVGISDHVEPEECMISPAVCVALGAKVLEKHFATDRSLGGGTGFSMTPRDLALFVRNVRLAEQLLGVETLGPTDAEQVARTNARRSLVANFDLKAGCVLGREMVGVKRPGTGMSPLHMDELVGRVLSQDVSTDTQFQWSHFAEQPAQGSESEDRQ